MKYLIIGDGYVGNYISRHLRNSVLYKGRINSCSEAKDLLLNRFPSYYLVNCAGKTGKPNVDWCEDHKEETIQGNIVLPIILAEACQELKQPWMHIASGCVYDGYEYSYDEESPSNFIGSFYSRTKIMSQDILNDFYDEICIVRIRMPIDEEFSERSFVSKLLKYARAGCPILSEPNSVTFLDDLVRAIEFLAEKCHTGTWNVVNRGSITAREILNMHKRFTGEDLQPDYRRTEEVLSSLRAGRSNCILDTRKLEREGLSLPFATDKLREVYNQYWLKKRKELENA